MAEQQQENILGRMVTEEVQNELGRLMVENAELKARNRIMSQHINNMEQEGGEKNAKPKPVSGNSRKKKSVGESPKQK